MASPSQIAHVLTQTLNPDTSTRVQAELHLAELLVQPSTLNPALHPPRSLERVCRHWNRPCAAHFSPGCRDLPETDEYPTIDSLSPRRSWRPILSTRPASLSASTSGSDGPPYSSPSRDQHLLPTYAVFLNAVFSSPAHLSAGQKSDPWRSVPWSFRSQSQNSIPLRESRNHPILQSVTQRLFTLRPTPYPRSPMPTGQTSTPISFRTSSPSFHPPPPIPCMVPCRSSPSLSSPTWLKIKFSPFCANFFPSCYPFLARTRCAPPASFVGLELSLPTACCPDPRKNYLRIPPMCHRPLYGQRPVPRCSHWSHYLDSSSLVGRIQDPA